MRRAIAGAAVAVLAAVGAAQAPDPLAQRRCQSMPNEAAYQACIERAQRSVETFRNAERRWR